MLCMCGFYFTFFIFYFFLCLHGASGNGICFLTIIEYLEIFFNLKKIIYLIFSSKMEAAVEDFKQEAEMLRNQVSTERSSVRNLENLLSTNREKDFQVQLENQEQKSEIQLVKDRLSLADSKL